MKKNKIFMALLVMVIFMVSCATKKNVPIALRKDFKGSWVITSTTVLGADGKLNVTAFDDVALKCFEGSVWVLPNNGYGSYTINGGAECSGGARQIIWSQRVNGGTTFFNFKKMDGVKKSDSKRVGEGYSLEVTSFAKNTFEARSSVFFEGKTVYIVYQFNRK